MKLRTKSTDWKVNLSLFPRKWRWCFSHWMSASTSPSRPECLSSTTAGSRTMIDSWRHQAKKCAPLHVVAHWVSSAWTNIPAELFAKSIKKCWISYALDGTKDDSDVDDPSSDYLPSTATMLVKTRIPHETKLPSVIQVPYVC